MEERNRPELWDKLWNDPRYQKKDLWGIQKEYRGIRWQRMSGIIRKRFGNIRGLKVIELGAGAGKVSALMARNGADVTLVDYSGGALKRASSLFDRLGLTAAFHCHDIFSLPEDFKNRFDVAMSFGLAEHFSGTRRIDVIRKHLDVLSAGGITFIAVPNRWNPPYRIYKAVTQLLGTWPYGEEYPFSRNEFREICRTLNINEYSFFGDSLIASLGYLHPFGSISKALGKKPPRQPGTFLDQYLSYSLVFCAPKT